MSNDVGQNEEKSNQAVCGPDRDAEISDLNLRTPKHFQIGDPVCVTPSYRYYADWQGWTGFIAGIHADKLTGRINYEVNDAFPPDRSGNTDGFYDGDLNFAPLPKAANA
jgi:hypothetical protein